MARGGIYKSEVLRARDKLLALGRYPSVDAVRQELGNTGSNTTIHRYLKEIEEEEGAKPSSKVAISEALQDLVARLSDRLQSEADGRIAEAAAKQADELTEQQQRLEAAEAEAAGLREALENVQAAFKKEQTEHRQTTERLQLEITAHARAAQQVTDLGDRLQVEEDHRRALEEKHTHAREALEHFRTSVKEQREQDVRQHEQQVQYLHGELKNLGNRLVQTQQEAAKLSKDNALLESELTRSEQHLNEANAELEVLRTAKDELISVKQQLDRLGQRVLELETQAESARSLNEQLELGRSRDQEEINQLRISLAAARAAVETQNQLAEKLQALMAQKPKPRSGSSSTTSKP